MTLLLIVAPSSINSGEQTGTYAWNVWCHSLFLYHCRIPLQLHCVRGGHSMCNFCRQPAVTKLTRRGRWFAMWRRPTCQIKSLLSCCGQLFAALWSSQPQLSLARSGFNTRMWGLSMLQNCDLTGWGTQRCLAMFLSFLVRWEWCVFPCGFRRTLLWCTTRSTWSR